jgi:hypothetical protein
LKPFEGPNRPTSVTEWLQGGSLLRPEIFHHRWRTDKDPTVHLASFEFIVKKPLSHSRDADDPSKVILEEDIRTQFEQQMAIIASCIDDHQTKTRALQQLKPVMNQFTSVVSRYVMDAKLLKTCQGRGAGRSNSCLIAIKGGVAKSKYPANGSQLSTLARAKNHQPSDSAASRKTPGNNNHIPEEEKWTCPMCYAKIKNSSDLISQHKKSQKHLDALKRMRHCDTCNVYFPNTPEEVNSHNSSLEHQRTARLSAEPDTRDGQVLASQTRVQNAGKVVQTAKQNKAKK